MRIIYIWCVPWIAPKVVYSIVSQDHLSHTGRDLTTLFLILVILAIWMFCIRSVMRERAQHYRNEVILPRSFIGQVTGRKYAMLPLDADEQNEALEQHKSLQKLRFVKEDQ